MNSSWISIPFKEIPVSTGNGINPFEYPEEEFELYSVPAHQTGRPEFVKGATIGSNKQLVKGGTVLLCKINPRINRVWVVKQATGRRQIASTEWIAFEQTTSVRPEFLAHFLRQSEVGDYLAANASGVGGSLMRVKASTFSEFKLRLTGTITQSRIVEKLEELLSDLDAGVSELKAAQKKLGQYRQSLLKAAVEGALTAQWRAQHTPTESGAQLLERILTERRARWEAKQLAKFEEQGKAPPKDWQKKYPEPVRPETSGLSELPKGWVWSSIGQCFQVAVGATPSRKEPSYWDGAIPWVSSGEVRFSRITATKEMITEQGLKNTSTQINPIGSVMLGMIGEGKTRGQVAILDVPAANNQNCAAIWASETDIPPEYVYYWLWSQYEETRRGSSGNNQPALNKSIVERISFPIAPLDELKQIVRQVDRELNAAAEQERAIEHALKQSAAQRKNILKAAFSGQLVPQDPDDEPAAVLLERIRAERVSSAGGRGRKGRPAASDRSHAC